MSIALVQQVNSGVNSGTQPFATYTTSNTVIGNIGIIAFWWNNTTAYTTGNISIADTQGNTWSLITGTFAQFLDSSSSANLGVALAWCRYTGATKNKVTVTFSTAPTFSNLNQLEYSGLATSGSPVDASNSFSKGSPQVAPPYTTGNITVANANSLGVGYFVSGGGITGSGAMIPNTGFTAFDNNNVAGFFWSGEYDLTLGSGTQAGDFSRTSSTAEWAACVASFLPAGLGGGPTVPAGLLGAMGCGTT